MNRINVNELTLRLLGVENPSTSITMPRFNHGANAMPTKTAPTMSEEEYKKAIVEQAKKDFENGKFGGHKNPSYMTLKNSFVSVTSPDRKGAIAQAFKSLPFMQRNKVTYMQVKDRRGNEINFPYFSLSCVFIGLILKK